MLQLLLVLAPLVSAEFLDPDSTNITYIGRTSAAKHGRLLDWAGVQVVARFLAGRGTVISADLKGSSTGDRFLVEIDGAIFKTFLLSPGPMQRVHLAKNLPSGEHVLSLWRISEDNAWDGLKGAATFGGFSATFDNAWEGFLAPPPAKLRRLEFWGDSNIAGWCVDGTPGGSDSPQAPVQNTYETWAAQLARELSADFVAEAISGIGVTEQSGGAMSDHVDGASVFAGPAWDYTRWIPDAVVFRLGLNDAHPRSQKFRDAYRSLMEHAAKRYAHATSKPKLIHVCGSHNDGSVDPCTSIQQVIRQFNSGRGDGFQSYYAPISTSTWNSVCNKKQFHGCDRHYNKAGHGLVKADLLPQIRRVLGWSEPKAGIVV